MLNRRSATSPEASPLVLASTSPYRRQILERLGIAFQARAPRCDETVFRHLPPVEQARALARLKAESTGAVAGLVIGSDQVLDLDGETFGKPGTPAAALAQLRRLAGQTHRLITAVAVHEPTTARTEIATDIHRLHMRALPDEILAAYIAQDRPLQCAGSYMLERRGIALFDRIEADPDTADANAIVGLPVTKLLALLRAFGLDLCATWAEPAP